MSKPSFGTLVGATLLVVAVVCVVPLVVLGSLAALNIFFHPKVIGIWALVLLACLFFDSDGEKS